MTTSQSSSYSTPPTEVPICPTCNREMHLRCLCGFLLKVHTSRTERNPCRWFVSYPQPRGSKCEYFVWVDPPTANVDEQSKSELDENVKKMQFEIGCYMKRTSRTRQLLGMCVNYHCHGPNHVVRSSP